MSLLIPSGSGGAGVDKFYKKVSEIVLTSSATEIIVSNLNLDTCDIFYNLINTSGSSIIMDIQFSADNGATFVSPDWYGVIITSTGAIDKWNGGAGYLKNSSKLWGKSEVKKIGNDVYINNPTRSDSNNRWRHMQGFIKNFTQQITDIKITASVGSFDVNSIVQVYGVK